MNEVLRGTGSPHNVILLGAGSEESVERSEISVQTEALATAGIRGIDARLGFPAVSGEVHYMGLVFWDEDSNAQVVLRGVTPAALEVHREVRLLEGHFPRTGEILVGNLAHHTLGIEASRLQPGARLRFEDQTFTVAGRFAAPGSIMESEIWMPRTDLITLTQRETLSCVIVRMAEADSFSAADLFAKRRLDLELTALPETAYYAGLAQFYGPLRVITWLTAAMVAAGAIFGGLNMLYAAFAARQAEIATLQVIGYSRWAVLVSLIQESLLAVLSGTLLAAFAAVFLLEGLSVNFSMGTFELTMSPGVITAGLLSGLLLGLAGALPPALSCLRAPLPQALRAL
jgi:putative ABC transport system permease protein